MLRLLRLMVLAVIVAVLPLLAARVEAATSLLADLDGDGVHDQASVEVREPTRVRVWLSRSGTTSILVSRRPVLGLAAVDLDGDRRAELIFSERKTLAVWSSRDAGLRHVPTVESRPFAVRPQAWRSYRSQSHIPPLVHAQDDDPNVPPVRSAHGDAAATLAPGARLWSSTCRPYLATCIAASAPRPPPRRAL